MFDKMLDKIIDVFATKGVETFFTFLLGANGIIFINQLQSFLKAHMTATTWFVLMNLVFCTILICYVISKPRKKTQELDKSLPIPYGWKIVRMVLRDKQNHPRCLSCHGFTRIAFYDKPNGIRRSCYQCLNCNQQFDPFCPERKLIGVSEDQKLMLGNNNTFSPNT